MSQGFDLGALGFPTSLTSQVSRSLSQFPYITMSNFGGADLADMLLGYPSAGNIYTSTKLIQFADYYGMYVQDDFRLSSKPTLNVGLRWEHETGLQEENNGLLVGFDGSAINPLGTKGVVKYAGTNGQTTVGNPYPNKWGPRFGFAYRLDSKTVVRGGYGMFWAPQFAISAPIATVGYNQATKYIATTNNFITSASSLSNPFPDGVLQPAASRTMCSAAGSSTRFPSSKQVFRFRSRKTPTSTQASVTPASAPTRPASRPSPPAAWTTVSTATSNSAAFSLAPQFTFGNIGRTLDMRGPGHVNWDMSLFKNFVIKEKLKCQFRFEALNMPLFYGENVAMATRPSARSTRKQTSRASWNWLCASRSNSP